MDNKAAIRVSLSAVRRGIEQLKPYLSQQFSTLPDQIKNNFYEYEKSLQLFRDSPESYRVLLAQVSEILGPERQYAIGTLGQKIFGCIRYENLPSDLVSCFPECLDALHDNSMNTCGYRVFEENASGQLQYKSPDNTVDQYPTPSAVVFLKTRSTLTPADITYLKQNGVTHVQRILSNDGGVRSSPFEPIDAPTTNLNAAPPGRTVVATVPAQSTSSNTGGYLILFIVIILILWAIWYWWKKKKASQQVAL